MITFLLLPYFLVSRVLVDVDSSVWHYGPEYTYRVNVNHAGYSGEQGASSPTRIFYASNVLNCRPRIPDTLTCRFDAVRMATFRIDLVDLAEDIANGWATDDEPFEIKFDRAGVTGLVVADTMRPSAVNAIRAIASQFQVGVDLRRTPDEFQAKERSYLGVCDADVAIRRRPSSQNDAKDDMFYIVTTNGLRRDPGELVEIAKTRNLNSCREKADYYFGSRDSYQATLTNSTSVTNISDSDFTSRTINTIVVDNPRKGEKITLHEEITLSLETISPTTADISAIPRPTITSFFVSHDDTSAV